MNSTSSSYDLNLSIDHTQMPENILENNLNQPLLTTTDIDLTNEEKHLLSNQDDSSSLSNQSFSSLSLFASVLFLNI